MHALKTNYEDTASVPSGPDIQKMLLDAPKYGNDDDYVDDIMVDYFRFICEEVVQYKTGTDRLHLAAVYELGILQCTLRRVCGCNAGWPQSGRGAGRYSVPDPRN